MKRKSIHALRTAFAALALVLAGCGGTPAQRAGEPDGNVAAGNYYVGTEPVYAHLRTGSGGSWVLGTVTTSGEEPADGYLVRLNDLAPAFDTRLAECEPQVYPADHKCSPAHPFRDKDVGMVGKIISGGIAAGTGGKVTDISGSYETTFDEAAFNRAVDEALTNTGLAGERRVLLELIDEYQSRAAAGLEELRSLRAAVVADYEDAVARDVRLAPLVGGLERYYTHDIDLRSLVRVEPVRDEAFAPDFSAPAQLLPCEARQCLGEARRRLAELEGLLVSRRSALQAARGDPDAVYQVSCERRELAGYELVVNCPDTVTRSELAAAPIPVTVTILARDFDALYPDLRLGDESLEVDISGGAVRLTNLTESYLTVSVQTLYYNSLVETIAVSRVLAPGVTVEQPLAEMAGTAMQIESRYEGMTPDKAASTRFRFGYAARYHTGVDAAETTLHDVRSFNVGCVIDNRLRPGSCRDPDTREAPVSEEQTSAPADPAQAADPPAFRR